MQDHAIPKTDLQSTAQSSTGDESQLSSDRTTAPEPEQRETVETPKNEEKPEKGESEEKTGESEKEVKPHVDDAEGKKPQTRKAICVAYVLQWKVLVFWLDGNSVYISLKVNDLWQNHSF